jgi:hypothetical protein
MSYHMLIDNGHHTDEATGIAFPSILLCPALSCTPTQISPDNIQNQTFY